MVAYSVISYFVLAIWYFCGTVKNQKIAMFISVLLSSFFAYWYLDVNNVGMIVYFILGLISIFFYWIVCDTVTNVQSKAKNKMLAGFLALFLGGYGIHRFYLKKNISGLMCLLFSWTYLPAVFGLINALILFVSKQDEFDRKYNSVSSYSTDSKQGNKMQTSQFTPIDFSEFLDDDRNGYVPINDSSKNVRNGDDLNYRNIRLCGYQAMAEGTIEDFVITVYKNGRSYTFKTKDGNICSSRSSEMRAAKLYEVS